MFARLTGINAMPFSAIGAGAWLSCFKLDPDTVFSVCGSQDKIELFVFFKLIQGVFQMADSLFDIPWPADYLERMLDDCRSDEK